MSVPVRAISPEALSVARRLYETTNVPMRHIADMLGIAKTTLSCRVKQLGWQPRRHRVARLALPPDLPPLKTSAPPLAPVQGEAALASLSRRALIVRLVARIEAEITGIEQLLALAGGPGEASVADAERAARTLAVLVRALRELAALEKNEPDGAEDDAAARDADAFRRELGATLERVLAAGEAG
ncbi:hypothetical protein ACO2RV_02025 [Ancylobacter sp. VNQ12]|uniref:hypothetical protein n=1 Tax=Ancylobacter sp. VNQ12 TaxID=3400920 RepID=UPI003C095E2F